jgi:FtsZ-interacting cell division protein YlmF
MAKNPIQQIKKTMGITDDDEDEQSEETQSEEEEEQPRRKIIKKPIPKQEPEDEEAEEEEEPAQPPEPTQQDVAKQILGVASKMQKIPVHSFAILPLKNGNVIMMPHDVTNVPVCCLLLDVDAVAQLTKSVLDAQAQKAKVARQREEE